MVDGVVGSLDRGEHVAEAVRLEAGGGGREQKHHRCRSVLRTAKLAEVFLGNYLGLVDVPGLQAAIRSGHMKMKL